jgi:hypothetical protein
MTVGNGRVGITMGHDVAWCWPVLPQPRGPRFIHCLIWNNDHEL